MDNYRSLGETAAVLADYFKSDPIIVSAYIFGSFGTGRQTPLSDLDLAVLFA